MGDELARQLHDRATRGEELSPEEKACLDDWYARQDEAEGRLLATASLPTSGVMRTQVNTTAAQLVTVTQRIQALVDENEVLRREIAALQRQLSRTPSAQPA